MENIFEDTYFGKPYKTKDNTIVKFVVQTYGDDFIIYIPKCKYSVETTHRYNSKGEFYLGNGEYGHGALDIVSEWQEPIVCKCQWKEYYDYRIMMPNGEGHVRLTIYEDEAIISDLYVADEHRHKGYATILLDKVDELLGGQKAFICPLEEWTKIWYERRGYIITKDESVDEEKLDKLAKDTKQYDDEGKILYKTPGEFYEVKDLDVAFKAGYRKAKED